MYHQVKMWEFAYYFRREPLIAFPPCPAFGFSVELPKINWGAVLSLPKDRLAC
jgi:hypothetical protein